MRTTSPTSEVPRSALRRLREQERRRLRGDFDVAANRAGERDVEFILPHLATSPTFARNFAVKVAEQLDGGTLPYDRRVALLASAEKNGIRLFEANLIIAAVQHNAVPMRMVRAETPQRRATDEVKRSWLRRWWKPIAVVLLIEAGAVAAYVAWVR